MINSVVNRMGFEINSLPSSTSRDNKKTQGILLPKMTANITKEGTSASKNIQSKKKSNPVSSVQSKKNDTIGSLQGKMSQIKISGNQKESSVLTAIGKRTCPPTPAPSMTIPFQMRRVNHGEKQADSNRINEKAKNPSAGSINIEKNTNKERMSTSGIQQSQEKNVLQKASEAFLAQKMMALLRSDIGPRPLFTHSAPLSSSLLNLSTSSSPVYLTLETPPGSAPGLGTEKETSLVTETKSESTARVYEAYLPRNKRSQPQIASSWISAAASASASSMLSSPELQKAKKILLYHPLIPTTHVVTSYDLQEELSSPSSFEEALEAIRGKLSLMKKKGGRKGAPDPLAQLAIVKGILSLAAMAAGCNALCPLPLIEDDEVTPIKMETTNTINTLAKDKEKPQDIEGGLLQVDLTPSGELLRAEGMRWLKRLAAQGLGGRHPLPEAQNLLAILLRGNGDPRLGIKTNLERAYTLSLQASKHGSPDASYWTAVCYEKGLGTKKDSARAVTFYRKAASQGHGKAMHRLALILQHAQLNTTPAPKEAFMWLKRAAAVGTIPAAIHDLALMYERGNGALTASIVIPDDAYALDLYKKAAAMNYAPSQVKLGTCYEYGRLGCHSDPRRSIDWYRRAADQGNPAAELALSGWYLTGAKVEEGLDDNDNDRLEQVEKPTIAQFEENQNNGLLQASTKLMNNGVMDNNNEDPNIILPQSDIEAYSWAKRAAERRDPRAEYAIGRYCELGVGLPAPALQEALLWYARAALQGHRKAKKRRSELKKSLKVSASSATISSTNSSIRFVKFLLSGGGRWGS